jgi:hypothetical protein
MCCVHHALSILREGDSSKQKLTCASHFFNAAQAAAAVQKEN